MYYIVYGFLWIISLLPLRVLYFISDGLYLLIYYVVKYRREVVKNNLLIAFPGKSEKERKTIEKKFYRNFTDNFIEFIKLFTAGQKFLQRHVIGDYSVCQKIYEDGKKCELLLAHNFNWEMVCLAAAPKINHVFIVVYMPILNKVFDKIFIKIRSKTGAVLLPATDLANALIPYRNEKYMLVLVADQNAGSPKHAYWVNFFNKPAPFVTGPEMAAKRGNMPVLFCKFIKQKRGYYNFILEMGCENPEKLEKGELTRLYANYLEQFINEHPEMWLWSHRRWKHGWEEGFRPVL